MKNSKKIVVAAASLCAVMTVSSICAYFTDKDAAINTFEVGNVSIDLQEPNWPDPDEPDNPPDVPGDETPKDPQVENTGKNDAYVFLKVAAPKDEYIRAAADGTRIDEEPVNQELFLVKSGDGDFDSLSLGYNKSEWELLTEETDTTSSEDYNFYVFAHKEIVKKGETTGTLFDKVKLCNAVEGYIDNNTYTIDINAYAIQSGNVKEDSGATSLDDIYKIYLNQNKDTV